MAKFETTQAQYQAMMGTNPSNFQGDLQRPVEMLSWIDITAPGGFFEILNAATAGVRPAGLVFRLPTESEWEYACRAGTTTRFFWGDDLTYLSVPNHGWFIDNSGGVTHPVGQKLPNPWGLYDMVGNVSEFCMDGWGFYPSAPATDPVAPYSSWHMARGSGFNGPDGTWFRSAFRNIDSYSGYRTPEIGFRVVLGAPRIP